MNKHNYLSVGINVWFDFSFMSIVDSQEHVILKPFKITHSNTDSIARSNSAIKKQKSRTPRNLAHFWNTLESIIFRSSATWKNQDLSFWLLILLRLTMGIRKVKNDKLDSIDIAKLGLKSNLKISFMPTELVLDLRSFTRLTKIWWMNLLLM